jgi:hypothetical protein
MKRTDRKQDPRGTREVKVSSYERGDGTPVREHTRTVSGRKKDILRDERELDSQAHNLIRDTRKEDYYKSEYDLYDIDRKAGQIQPMVKEAQYSQEGRTEAENARGQARVQKENRKAAAQVARAKKKEIRNYRKEERLKRKAKKREEKLESIREKK